MTKYESNINYNMYINCSVGYLVFLEVVQYQKIYIHSKTKVCPKVLTTHIIVLFETIDIRHCNCLFFIDLSVKSYCGKCKDLEFVIS